MSAPMAEPTVAEIRAMMRRASESGDRCSCGATYRTGHWDPTGGILGHMHFSRFRDEEVDEPAEVVNDKSEPRAEG